MNDDRRTAYGRAAIDDEVQNVREAEQGSRNNTLNAAAFALGRLLEPCGLDEAHVEGALYAAALDIGLASSEAHATIRSGLDAGKQQPRSLEQLGERSSSFQRPPSKPKAILPALKSRAARTPLTSEQRDEALRAWQPLAPDDSNAAHHELARRGLLPALTSGAFRAYQLKKGVRVPGASPTAVAFEATNPDGQVTAIKFRNPGEEADLKQLNQARYGYVKGHKASPWCSPNIKDVETHFLTEGELNGVAAHVAFEACNRHIGVQGLAGKNDVPYLDVLKDCVVYICGHPDAPDAAQRWADQAREADAASVHLLPELPNYIKDVCDLLAAHGPQAAGAILQDLMHQSLAMHLSAKTTPSMLDDVREGAYYTRQGRLYREKTTARGTFEIPLANFAARITAEIIRDDGSGYLERYFEVQGVLPNKRVLRTLTLKARDFNAMTWPLEAWGVHASLPAGHGAKDSARAAIQHLSSHVGVEERIEFTHTGWTENHPVGPLYLTGGASIGRDGVVPDVRVVLPGRLASFALPEPPQGDQLRKAVRASLALLPLAPDDVAIPILGAAYRAPLGRVDFTVFATGRTGSHKTTFNVLALNHFGHAWKLDRLPEGWESTPNALERHAYAAKDILFPVDDFKPRGPHDAAHKTLSRYLRSQADGAGRSRMDGNGRDTHASFYPRGFTLTSAEDVPQGHSDQARTLIVPVRVPLIGKLLPNGKRERSEEYYAAEDLARKGIYAQAMAGYVQFVAQHYDALHASKDEHVRAVRQLTSCFPGAHDRTPRNCAELARGWQVFLTFAVACDAITLDDAAMYWHRVVNALAVVAQSQAAHHEEVDPIQRFMALLRASLSSGRAYLGDAQTGEAPQDHEEQFGWRLQLRGSVRVWEPTSGATRIGWFGTLPDGQACLLLDKELTIAHIVQLANSTGMPLALTAASLGARLKEAGILGPCETNKTEHRRSVHGQHERLRLWHILFKVFNPVEEEGTTGTRGTEKHKSSFTPAVSFVPSLS